MTSFVEDSFICFSFSNSEHKLILYKQFIKDKMNHITCKLLGLTDDELSTVSPSKDANGIYTIFKDLDINFHDFKYLILFLRTGQLDEQHMDKAMMAAIVLGGFPELDQYREKCLIKPPLPPKKTHPIIPIDDIDNEYNWTLVRIQEHSYSTDPALSYIKSGWSFSGGIISDNNANTSLMCLRKIKESE